jgi:hypothetical protein
MRAEVTHSTDVTCEWNFQAEVVPPAEVRCERHPVKPDVAVSKEGLLIPKISLGDPNRELRRKVLAAPPLMLRKTPGTDVCPRPW